MIDWLITTLFHRADCSGNKKNDRGKKHSANGLLQCHFMLHRYQCLYGTAPSEITCALRLE